MHNSPNSAAAPADKPSIPVVLAADDRYAPMVATTIYSMLENASDGCFLDITVMTTDISAENQETMRSFLEREGESRLTFMDVTEMMGNYELSTNNEHIGVETYYRFLIQDALPAYDKVVYLDSDLVVEGDVAELFAADLHGNVIGAVLDIDYLGVLNWDGGERLRYSTETLALEDPYGYFQAGVLVLDTASLRRAVSVQDWLDAAGDTRFIFNDQDILNAFCEGSVEYLDASWNVMHDGGGRVAGVCSFAPAPAYEAYLAARTHEKVIHYAGREKPWNKRDCDRGEAFWRYARETPYHDELQARLARDSVVLEEQLKREQLEAAPLVPADSPLRTLVDLALPPDSRRRGIVRAAARSVVRLAKRRP